MGCVNSVGHTTSFYDSWPLRAKPEGKRRWYMPYAADEDVLEDCTDESRALTHLHASSSATFEGQRTAHHQRQGSSGLQCSSAWLSRAGEDYGVQKYNQDSAFALGSFNGSIDQALFGVMDGHGPNGHRVSQHIRNIVPDLLKRHLKVTDVRQAMTAVFEDAQRSLEGCSYSTELSGSTCVLAHLHRRQLAVGWVGDSRAVMGRARGGGRHLAVPLTQDHKPAEPLESARILAAGGRVERIQGEDGEEVGPHRVWLQDAWMPGLAMSRALGDGLARRAGVISEPEVCVVDLNAGDDFLILGSDGLFEFLENHEAVEIVSGCNNDERACSKLIAAAHQRWMERESGCTDDITALVVRFKVKGPPASKANSSHEHVQ